MSSLPRAISWLALLLLCAAGSARAADGDDDDSASSQDEDGPDADQDGGDPNHDHGEKHDHDHGDSEAPVVKESVTVTAKRPSATDTKARVEIDGTALERTRGQDLAEAIESVSGVTVARGSADTTKPIIRGQSERRLLVFEAGVRHESQKWGADHATEIDPFAAGRISVIKGAASVRYGPDAIGGVVLVEPPRLLTTPGVDGVVQFVGVANGLRPAGAARLDFAPAKLPGFVVRVEGNYARGSSIRTPRYVLGNTASQIWNAGATLHYHRGPVHLTLSYNHYDLRAGIFYGMTSSTPASFFAGLENDIPIGAENWRVRSVIDRPRQQVTHDKIMARAEFFLARAGTLRLTYALQLNHRAEFEQVRGSVQGPQYDFALETHSLDLTFDHSTAVVGEARFRGGLGVALNTQDNVYNGLPLIPNHRALTLGVFGYERLNTRRFALEVGVRYDPHGRNSFLTHREFDRHDARGSLSEDQCEERENNWRCGLGFDTGNLSVGGLVHIVPDVLDLKLDLATASRFPNGDELFMNGSAPTFPVFARGDPSLGPETTWSLSPTVGLRLPWFEGEVSAYFSYIDDFIAFAPELTDAGDPRFDVTIRGAFPRFSYRAVDSLFYGVDGGFTVGPNWPVQVRMQGAIVRGEELETGAPLPFVPGDRISGSVRWTPPHLGALHDAFIELNGVYVFEQRQTDETIDFAPPPPAYFLLGAGVGARFHVRGDNTLEIGLEGGNLLNARYREYTSLRRYVADEPGLDVRLRVRFEFHQHPRARSLDDESEELDPDHHPDRPAGPDGVPQRAG